MRADSWGSSVDPANKVDELAVDSTASDGPSQAPDALDEPVERSARPSEWGSLVADLSRTADSQPAWRVHDRTHLEFAVDYALRANEGEEEFEWEAYFFVPKSLRLDSVTYSREHMFADLQSYVRLAVPQVEFHELTGAPMKALAKAWAGIEAEDAVREARLFACEVRAAGVRERKAILQGLTSPATVTRGRAVERAQQMADDAVALTAKFRTVIEAHQNDSESKALAARWVDEDVSKAIETVLGQLSLDLSDAKAPKQITSAVRQAAVAEARYRRRVGLDTAAQGNLSERDVEHLEFRRHVLKRFTSSVLWLRADQRDPGTWAMHALYALAASVAMAFGIGATLLAARSTNGTEQVWLVSLVAILAYAARDRTKAGLQKVFSNVVWKRFPHRRWFIVDAERDRVIGRVDEQSGFVPPNEVPGDVLACRRSTGRQPLEEKSAPETVLRHHKYVMVKPADVRAVDTRFDALTEIFRLDLRRWLSHTDDPKREILYADPNSGRICAAKAPRVYNIGVVYRLRRKDDDVAQWHRVRVVVNRKGINRIEHVSAEGGGLSEAPVAQRDTVSVIDPASLRAPGVPRQSETAPAQEAVSQGVPPNKAAQ